jgi:sec-independent protein translocase protein TatA
MLNSLAMLNPETMLIIAAVVLLLFGGSKIPQLMRGIGQGVGELKKGMEEGQRVIMDAAHHEPKPEPKPEPEPTLVPTTPTTTSTN